LLYFNPIINQIAGVDMTFSLLSLKVMDHNREKVVIPTDETLAALFTSGGIKNRHNLVDYLHGFGGIMDAIGALSE
jgi:hypothetical protein